MKAKYKKIILLLFLFLCGFLFFWYLLFPLRCRLADKYIQKGGSLNFQKAYALCSKKEYLIKDFEKKAELFFLEGKIEEALGVCEQNGLFGLKKILLQIKDAGAAEEKLYLAESLLKEYPLISKKLAEEAVNQNQNFRDGFLVLGKINLILGNFEKAEENFNNAKNLDFDFPQTYLFLESLYRAQGKNDLADENLRIYQDLQKIGEEK